MALIDYYCIQIIDWSKLQCSSFVSRQRINIRMFTKFDRASYNDPIYCNEIYNGPVNTRWSSSKISPPSQSSGRDVGDLEAGRRLGRMCISRDTDPPDVLRRVRLPSESLSGAEGWPFCRPE